MDKEYISILENYVSNVGGHVIVGTLQEDIILRLNWTQKTWEDGIPVNKYFSRCENPLKITIKEGTEIAGGWYRGLHSGCHMFTFKHNDIWFEAQRYDAEEILQALGRDPDEEDSEE